MEPTQPIETVQTQQVPQPVNEVPVSNSQGVIYAGFLTRLLAGLIDGVLLGIVFGILWYILGAFKGNQSGAATGLFNLITYPIQIVYYVYFTGKTGQTLGKKAMGIKVVKKNTMAPPGYVGAFLRDIVGKLISSVVILLGYFWMLWDKEKQTWHDKIAGTIVIKVGKNA